MIFIWCGSRLWFLFYADTDSDADPGYQNDADLDPQHWSVRYIPVYGASVADQGYLSQIRISFPDPKSGSATKKFTIFKPKSCSGNPGCLSRIQIFFHSGIHGPKKHRIPDPEHWMLQMRIRMKAYSIRSYYTIVRQKKISILFLLQMLSYKIKNWSIMCVSVHKISNLKKN